jgi:multiple sugar transport system substrate-binding protein
VAGGRQGHWYRLVVSLTLSLACLGAGAQQRQTLVVAAYPAVDEIVRSAIPAWKRLHPDVDIRVLSRGFEDHHTVMVTALSTATNLPDVTAVEVGYLGRFAAAGRLQDLSQPPFLAMDLQPRFVPFAWSQATSPSGAMVAVPADIGPGTLLYRVDLLHAAGVSEADLTRSWDSYIDSGIRIKAATGASLLPHARNLAELLIHANIQPAQGLYFDSKGGVLVESERFVHAFEMARKLRRLNLDAGETSWTGGWMSALRGGSVATVMSGAWMAGHLAAWIAPQSRGQWRAVQLPARAWSTWGGTFYAIPQGATNKPMAWEFIRLMTLNRDRQAEAFKSQNAFPALLAVHDDPFFAQSIDFLGGQKARLLWRDVVSHVRHEGVHELDLDARIIVSTQLNKVLEQGKEIPLALHDARVSIEYLARQGRRP